jgi:hypothetical protein
MARTAILGIALVCSLAGSAHAVPVSCTTMTTLDQFIAQNPGGGCFVQDKLFSDFSYSGGGSVTASAVHVATSFGVGSDIHGFTLTPAPGTGVWTTGFSFGYTITVSPPDPSLGIAGASLQINLGVLSNPASAVSTKSNGVVQTALFGSATDVDVFAPVPSLSSSTVVTIPTGGFLISLEEHYVQGVVPEPQTALLIGSGLAGLALRASRRRR